MPHVLGSACPPSTPTTITTRLNPGRILLNLHHSTPPGGQRSLPLPSITPTAQLPMVSLAAPSGATPQTHMSSIGDTKINTGPCWAKGRGRAISGYSRVRMERSRSQSCRCRHASAHATTPPHRAGHRSALLSLLQHYLIPRGIVRRR